MKGGGVKCVVGVLKGTRVVGGGWPWLRRWSDRLSGAAESAGERGRLREGRKEGEQGGEGNEKVNARRREERVSLRERKV